MNIDELAAKTTDKMKSRIDKVLSYINKMNKRDQVMFLLPIESYLENLIKEMIRQGNLQTKEIDGEKLKGVEIKNNEVPLVIRKAVVKVLDELDDFIGTAISITNDEKEKIRKLLGIE